MAIAEMSKLNLVVMSYERDRILNALQATCAAEITEHAFAENTHSCNIEAEDLNESLAAAERALDYLTSGVNDYRKDNKIKAERGEELVLSYSEFLAQRDKKAEADGIISAVAALAEEKKRLQAELAAARRQKALSLPFSTLTKPFAYYASTQHAEVRLGLLSLSAFEGMASFEEGEFTIEKLAEAEGQVLAVALFHKSFEGDRLLQSAGFIACPYKEGVGRDIYGRGRGGEG